MQKAYYTVSLLLGLTVLLTAGCCMKGPAEIKHEMSLSSGKDYDRVIGLTLGRTSMALARWGLKVAGEDEIPIKGIRKVRVGIYEVENSWRPASTENPARQPDLPGWEPIVRMHDDGENVMVMIRQRGERIKSMLVVVDEPEQLVIVRIWGNLDRLLEEAIRYGFEEIDRPDLIEPAIENSTRDLKSGEAPLEIPAVDPHQA